MRDASRGPFEFRSGRLGRTPLGAGTVVVDDDAITLVAPATDERSIRLRLGVVQSITVAPGTVTFELRDGTLLALDGPRAAELRAAVLEGCRAIPELTRALRALGSRRGHGSARETGPDEQQRFFAPLMAARRSATQAPTPREAITAFDASSLERQFLGALHLFAVQRYPQPTPARRALEAELVDLVEPLRDELTLFGAAAAAAVDDVEDLARWRIWSQRLQLMFEVADRVWLSLDEALDARGPWRALDEPGDRKSPTRRGVTPPRPPFRRHR
jgi:hypothetical protein